MIEYESVLVKTEPRVLSLVFRSFQNHFVWFFEWFIFWLGWFLIFRFWSMGWFIFGFYSWILDFMWCKKHYPKIRIVARIHFIYRSMIKLWGTWEYSKSWNGKRKIAPLTLAREVDNEGKSKKFFRNIFFFLFLVLLWMIYININTI